MDNLIEARKDMAAIYQMNLVDVDRKSNFGNLIKICYNEKYILFGEKKDTFILFGHDYYLNDLLFLIETEIWEKKYDYSSVNSKITCICFSFHHHKEVRVPFEVIEFV